LCYAGCSVSAAGDPPTSSSPLKIIIDQISAIGVNSARLPWANETFEKKPIVPDGYQNRLVLLLTPTVIVTTSYY
jgi:hypothetical protein